MKRLQIAAIVVLWFGFGYIGAAEWAGGFYAEYGHGPLAVMTKTKACRTSLGYFLAGPFGAGAGFILTTSVPMWDWPKYAFKYEDVEPR